MRSRQMLLMPGPSTANGQVRVHFKNPNRFGAIYAQMSPHTVLARLRALVPWARAHTALYYGVLSDRHGLRSAVVRRAQPVVDRQARLMRTRYFLERHHRRSV